MIQFLYFIQSLNQVTFHIMIGTLRQSHRGSQLPIPYTPHITQINANKGHYSNARDSCLNTWTSCGSFQQCELCALPIHVTMKHNTKLQPNTFSMFCYAPIISSQTLWLKQNLAKDGYLIAPKLTPLHRRLVN